jgi:hypothetical protein
VSAVILFVVLAIIAITVLKTPGGMTSLIGLFFLGTILWVAPRPLVALVSQDENIYTLIFGQLAAPRGAELCHLLAFWSVGVGSLFGGYFLYFRSTCRGMIPLGERNRTYCTRSFIAAFIIVAILLPILERTRFVQFATGGYTALYMNQAESSFSFLPLLDYLVPMLFALSVIIGEKRYRRLMVAAVIVYAFCGILFGRRMEVGTWLLVMLWYYSTIRRKPVRIGRLLLGFAVACYAFQSIEMLRTGSSVTIAILAGFFVSQGIIFMIPALSWQLSSPPVHTILGSLLSMRHFYRLLDIGSVGTANILDYISAQSGPALFESGNGLSSTGYLDIYYICGQQMILYAAACVLLGYLLRKWEVRAASNRVALFFLCVCLPSIFFVQRSTIFSVTSPVVYLSFFMAATYILHLLLNLVEFNELHAESIYGAY